MLEAFVLDGWISLISGRREALLANPITIAHFYNFVFHKFTCDHHNNNQIYIYNHLNNMILTDPELLWKLFFMPGFTKDFRGIHHTYLIYTEMFQDR